MAKLATLDVVEAVEPALVNIKEIKKSIGKFWSKLGYAPHFYSEDSVYRFERALTSFGITADHMQTKLDYIPETLYTIVPPINIKPVEIPTSPSDEYGVVRLDLHQFLLRPNFANVLSCHALSKYNDMFPAGNLGYIYNPAWASFGVYKVADSKTYISDDSDYSVCGYIDSELIGELPNILATVNVCFGYDNEGRRAVMFSKYYGEYLHAKLGFVRLIRYFYMKGFVVHVAYGVDYNAVRIAANVVRVPMGFHSMPIKPQLSCGTYTYADVARICLPKRYDDIGDAYYAGKYVMSGEPAEYITVIETHDTIEALRKAYFTKDELAKIKPDTAVYHKDVETCDTVRMVKPWSYLGLPFVDRYYDDDDNYDYDDDY